MALVASIGLFFFRSENDLTIKSIVETASCTTTNLASGSSMLTSKLLSNDTNWAGYIVASDLQNPQASITSISASWTVPAVTISTQDTFSAIWIGIGGFFDNTLIQAGTEQDSIQGQSEYSAWLELLPQNSFTIDTLSVSPGPQRGRPRRS